MRSALLNFWLMGALLEALVVFTPSSALVSAVALVFLLTGEVFVVVKR